MLTPPHMLGVPGQGYARMYIGCASILALYVYSPTLSELC